jgi:hypothetical protein
MKEIDTAITALSEEEFLIMPQALSPLYNSVLNLSCMRIIQHRWLPVNLCDFLCILFDHCLVEIWWLFNLTALEDLKYLCWIGDGIDADLNIDRCNSSIVDMLTKEYYHLVASFDEANGFYFLLVDLSAIISLKICRVNIIHTIKPDYMINGGCSTVILSKVKVWIFVIIVGRWNRI